MIEGFQLGVISTGFAVASLFFVRFYRDTRERLFLCFGVAFAMLSLNHAAFLWVPEQAEGRTWLYLLRLVAFMVIAAGIFDKNRRGSND